MFYNSTEAAKRVGGGMVTSVRGLPGRIGRTFRDHLILGIITLVYILALYLAGAMTGKLEQVSVMQYYNGNSWTLNIWFLVGLICLYMLYVVIMLRPERLVSHIWRDISTKYLTLERLIPALPVLLLMPLYLSAFTSFKLLIPAMQPFVWDVTFAEWDKFLHGGYHPWEILHPVLGYPMATRAINFGYQLWFLFLHAVLFWQTFSLGNAVLRMQFLVSFLLVWGVVGTAAATLLSSAGPCYFGRVTGLTDPYAPLLDYLNNLGGEEPLQALVVQEWLWEVFSSDQSSAFGGISAMPSVHVAMATLFALVGWRTHRWLGVILTAFAVLILVGSVHLGWHYALDGYMGCLATLAIWILVGKLLRRRSGNSVAGELSQ